MATATKRQTAEQRAERAEQEREQRKAESDARIASYVEMEVTVRKSRTVQVQREFDEISDEMRSIPPTSALWQERRDAKLELVRELQDIAAAEAEVAYNDRRGEQENRSDNRKQYAIAQNAPFNREPPPIGDESMPGGSDPSRDEQNPDIDSVALLKRGEATIDTSEGTATKTTTTAATGGATAKEAAHRE